MSRVNGRRPRPRLYEIPVPSHPGDAITPERWEQVGDRGHRHVEAFCVMKYRSDDGVYDVRLWNSRDGVTPFGFSVPIHAPMDQPVTEVKHYDWHGDIYDPNYVPRPGEFVCIDVEPESYIARMVEVYLWRFDQTPEYAPPTARERRRYAEKLAMSSCKEAVERGEPWIITAGQWHDLNHARQR